VLDGQVPLGLGLRARGLGRGGVAGHEGQALGPGGKAVAAQDAPHAVGREHQAAPALARELGGDAPGAEAGVGQAEGQNALLDHRADLVGHPGRPALARGGSRP
jgi:hypothetical protein